MTVAIGPPADRLRPTLRLALDGLRRIVAQALEIPLESVREALAAHGIAADRVLLVPAGMLPRTTSGKIRRREVAHRIEQHGA